MNLTLKLTCSACPEQYDVLDENGAVVGYLRLRHGNFRAEAFVARPDGGQDEFIVYTASPVGDGCFEHDERVTYLDHALDAIERRISPVPMAPPGITFQEPELCDLIGAARYALTQVQTQVQTQVGEMGRSDDAEDGTQVIAACEALIAANRDGQINVPIALAASLLAMTAELAQIPRKTDTAHISPLAGWRGITGI